MFTYNCSHPRLHALFGTRTIGEKGQEMLELSRSDWLVTAASAIEYELLQQNTYSIKSPGYSRPVP